MTPSLTNTLHATRPRLRTAGPMSQEITTTLLSGDAKWFSIFCSITFNADGTCKFSHGADGTWEVVKNSFDATKGEFALKIVRGAFPTVFGGDSDPTIQQAAELSPFFFIEGEFVAHNEAAHKLTKTPQ